MEITEDEAMVALEALHFWLAEHHHPEVGQDIGQPEIARHRALIEKLEAFLKKEANLLRLYCNYPIAKIGSLDVAHTFNGATRQA
jgi:hypothetical protein